MVPMTMRASRLQLLWLHETMFSAVPGGDIAAVFE